MYESYSSLYVRDSYNLNLWSWWKSYYQLAGNRAELVEKVHEIIGIDVNFTTKILAEKLKTSKNAICITRELKEDQKSERVLKKKTEFISSTTLHISLTIAI